MRVNKHTASQMNTETQVGQGMDLEDTKVVIMSMNSPDGGNQGKNINVGQIFLHCRHIR
jgi:hypothetical protein